MKRTHRMTIVGALALLLVGVNYLVAQDWPQWRGPDRDSKVVGFTPPKAWPKSLTKKWSATVGDGVSSPVMVGDKVYVFGRPGGADEVITCLDANTGKEIWKDKYATPAVKGAAAPYPGPRATPVVADGKVFTNGVNGVVSCLDAASGKVVWRSSTGAKPQFYTSSSPLVADGLCVVFLDALTAFDVAKGDVKWKWTGGTPYGSPVLMTVDGIKQVVTPASGLVAGVKLADGKALWQFKFGGGSYFSTYGTPIIDGNTVIYSSPTGKTGGATVAYNIEKKGDTFSAVKAWDSTFAPDKYNTPLVKDGLLFGLNTSRNFVCLDAKTGKEIWKDSANHGEAAGILNAGSVLLALTGKGELIAFEPSKAGYKEVAKYSVGPTQALAYPIISNNRVYVRGTGSTTLTMFTLD